ncbi:MAG: hypothetical protein ACR2I2_08260 [Bryobacteraceae bacterium]
MRKTFLKSLGLLFGGGLALGAGIKIGHSSSKLTGRQAGADRDSLLELIHAIDNRVEKVEATRYGGDSDLREPGVAGALEASLAFQSAHADDLNKLRSEIHAVGERSANELSDLGTRMEQLESRLSNVVIENVGARFSEVELRLRRDFEEGQRRSIESFGEALQTKIVQQISTLEHNLTEQSATVGQLREASVRADRNVQAMMLQIERLCEQLNRPAPAADATSQNYPSSQVNDRRPQSQPFGLERSRPGIPNAEPAKPDNKISEFSLA